MQQTIWIGAAFFLPLFPMGMVFNALLQRARNPWLRSVMLLLWPLPGIWILQVASPVIPGWVVYWSIFSAALYGFRAVVVRELGIWIGYLATSAWAMIWIGPAVGAQPGSLAPHALAFGLPLALMVLLAWEIERRYESAYVGIVSGLAHVQPRLSGTLVVAMLAAIGTPLFPAFFAMLDTLNHSLPLMPVAVLGPAVVWLLWSWSGMRLLQELLIGSAPQSTHNDISLLTTTAYGLALLLLGIGGLLLSRTFL